MNGRIKGYVAMFVSKTFSGLNENALRYLLPAWMSAYSGVVLRLVFGTLFFWTAGIFTEKHGVTSTLKQRAALFFLGAVCVFGYMFALLMGLTYTTPITSSIFISMQPIWVFLICVLFMHEKVTVRKVTGIVLGLGGALIIVATQKAGDVASDPLLGSLYCLLSSLLYAVYLVIEKRMLLTVDKITVLKWTFLGGAFSAVVMICSTGWYAPVLSSGLFSVPMLTLMFVLLFPTSISYLLLTVGLRNLSATVVALYGYLILIVAAVVSYILGQDQFSWWQILSMAMIVASVYFVEIAEMKEVSSPLSEPSSEQK